MKDPELNQIFLVVFNTNLGGWDAWQAQKTIKTLTKGVPVAHEMVNRSNINQPSHPASLGIINVDKYDMTGVSFTSSHY